MAAEGFQGKNVVITGASGGIGRALSQALAASGARLFLTGRNPERLMATRTTCLALGARHVEIFPADLSSEPGCRALIEAAVRDLGGIDVLINNAGMMVWTTLASLEDPIWIARAMEVNYYSMAYTTYHALPHLLASRGRLVAVSSVAGLTGVPYESLYAASKHAIHGLMDSLRIDLAGSGVSVTTAAPDFVDTEIFDAAIDEAGGELRGKVKGQQSISPERCAQLILKGVSRRKRLVFTSWRSRFGGMLRGLLPALIDVISVRVVRGTGLPMDARARATSPATSRSPGVATGPGRSDDTL